MRIREPTLHSDKQMMEKQESVISLVSRGKTCIETQHGGLPKLVGSGRTIHSKFFDKSTRKRPPPSAPHTYCKPHTHCKVYLKAFFPPRQEAINIATRLDYPRPSRCDALHILCIFHRIELTATSCSPSFSYPGCLMKPLSISPSGPLRTIAAAIGRSLVPSKRFTPRASSWKTRGEDTIRQVSYPRQFTDILSKLISMRCR